MDALSNVLLASDINDLLAESKAPKGTYKIAITNFGTSGAHYLDFATVPGLQNREQAAVAQSVKNNLDKIMNANPNFPKCKIAKTGDTVLLVNLAVHAAKLVENESDDDDTDNTDDDE